MTREMLVPSGPPGSSARRVARTDLDGVDDATVIAQSCGQPEVFSAIFERHAAPLGRYASRRLGPAAAEDVVAEAFLIAFRQRHRYHSEHSDARPWLYGITSNLIGRHRREEIRRLRAWERTGVDPLAEAFTDAIDEKVTADASGPRLAAALASLNRGQREVLLLVAWADLTYDQVAEALGIAEGTVRSRMNRARARLRQALDVVASQPTNRTQET